jgi:Flp pilus assembly protein TadG
MVALMAPVLVGFTALTVDVGRLYVRKQALSNAVDAAALAGGRELPNKDAADAEVRRVAAANRIDVRQLRTQFERRTSGGVAVRDVSSGSDFNYLKVTAVEDVPMTFARIFGIEQWPVDSKAAVSVTGGDRTVNTIPSGSTPFGIDKKAIDGNGNVSAVIHACDFQQFWVLPFGNQPEAVANMIVNGNPNSVSVGDLLDVASPKNPNYWLSVIHGVEERVKRAGLNPNYASQTPGTATASNPRVVIVALVEPVDGTGNPIRNPQDATSARGARVVGFAAMYLLGTVRQEINSEGAKQYILDGKLVDIVTPDAAYDPNKPNPDPNLTQRLIRVGGELDPLKLRLVE